MLTRAKMELDLDAVWTSDDIGTQTSAFFSLEIFQTFFKPYYQELIEHAHSLGMHFWLHTCGNVRSFIPDLIEIGLDVLHPIQKHTMDEKENCGAILAMTSVSGQGSMCRVWYPLERHRK